MSGAPPGGGFLDGLVRFVRWYEGVAEGAARWYRENEPAIRRFVHAGLDFAERFPIAMAATSATFARGGWSEVPLGNMELGELTSLVERLWDEPDDGVVRRELDGAILAYFSRDGHAELSELVDGWREHFAGRHETFEEALSAHKEGLYRLTIPALAAQIEGILRDLTREYGEGRRWIRRFNEAFGFDYHPRRPPPQPDLEDEMSRFAALPAVERFAAAEEMRRQFTLRRINELYDSGDFADPRYASSVRRHAILHGVFDGFGELESLRLFFVLDLLHDAVGEYEERVWFAPISAEHLEVLEEWSDKDPGRERWVGDFLDDLQGRAGERDEREVRVGWIVMRGSDPAGLAGLRVGPDEEIGRATLYVAPAFRGSGIGTKALGRAVREARGMGLAAVEATLDRYDPAAVRCLEKAGFDASGMPAQYAETFRMPLETE